MSDDVTEPVGLAARCSVDGAEISIETSAGVHNAYAAFQLSQESPVVPLNAGWQGFIAPGGGSGATALVLLSCENWSAKEGSGILVMADPPAGAKVTESTRLQLARVATGTARRAAQKTGCATETKEEGKAGELTAPAATAKTVPAGNATGTCKGMTSAKTVRETAAGVSPVEECLLVGGLQLTAAYGPFSNSSDAVVDGEYGGHDSPSGVERSTAWTSAACQGALGVGYYRASPVEGSDREFSADPLTKEERQDLEHFAEQSAARHACSTPKALPR
ncbi:hypothetical protein ABZ930_30235 [Streptomyces sp. NPDC046716]|uniref:hypothetical protein n=1 Tax=Streptomyces sp. NPDC046716 TaxID=3157093 RepID=UPI0033F1A11F